MIKKTATVVQLIAAQLIVLGVYLPRDVQSESAPSPTLNDMYRIESEYMHVSDFPNNFVLYDILMIDLDADKVKETEIITADLYLPYVPYDLDNIVLFDGYHIAHFAFERINDGCVRIQAWTRDLAGFDGTVGLYLFVTGYKN